MLKSIVSLTGAFGRILRRIFKFKKKSQQAKRVAVWVRDHGDETLRLNYDLNENSTVFDLGGYKGEWADEIFTKYCCAVHIFEPVPDFAETIKQRFEGNSKIHVYDFGLAGEKRIETIAICEDESSTFKQSEHSVDIRLVNALEFMKTNNINTIDLMKINIEGGEYELIEHFIEGEFIKEIKDIQIQFHDFVPDAEVRMKKIQEALEKTHFLTYQYEFVWENWRRKGM